MPLVPEEILTSPVSTGTKDYSNAACPRKRKPRKLNRSQNSPTRTNATKPAETEKSIGVNAEIETLKSRLRDLEVQVEELYQKAIPGSPPKQPRRRGRGRGGPPPPGSPEELVRLESELAATRQELVELRTKAAVASGKLPLERPTAASGEAQLAEDAVEEIPRTSPPTAEDQALQRQVTLAGSYRIPLPSSVSLDDVRTIQSGISSANNVARSLVNAHRAQRAAATAEGQTRTTNSDRSRKGPSWGEWIGGYSMTIARVVSNLEAEAAVEQGPITTTTTPPLPTNSRKPAKMPSIRRREDPAQGNPSTKEQPGFEGRHTADRPTVRSSNRGSGSDKGLSHQQVETLMA